jgi:hypothetical protein
MVDEGLNDGRNGKHGSVRLSTASVALTKSDVVASERSGA